MTLARDTDQIESARLLLRRLTPSDLDSLTQLHLDPQVMHYINLGRVRSPQDTQKWLRNVLDTYEKWELGQLAVVRKADGALIGRCGLGDYVIEAQPATPGALRRSWFNRADAPPGVQFTAEREMGYTFARSVWGQGYASEAAGRVMSYVREVRHWPRIVSVIHPENVASQRVAHRHGAQLEGDVDLGGRPHDLYVWPLAPSSS